MLGSFCGEGGPSADDSDDRCLLRSRKQSLSICVFVSEAANESKGNDKQIECHRPMTDVIKVILNALRDGGITAPTIHLGPTCYAHFQIVAAIVIAYRLHEFLHENGALWSWTDHTHLTLEHVEKLRQFVQTCFSEDFANPSTTWVVFYRPTRVSLFDCGHHHGSELEHAK